MIVSDVSGLRFSGATDVETHGGPATGQAADKLGRLQKAITILNKMTIRSDPAENVIWIRLNSSASF